jgi:iron complex outermembrane receptor protein
MPARPDLLRAAAHALLAASIVLTGAWSNTGAAQEQNDRSDTEPVSEGSTAVEADFTATTTADHANWHEAPAGGAESQLNVPDKLPAAANLATELERMPGIAVRRTGGPGDSAYVALRGSDPYHVRVLLHGIPLNGALNTSVDFGSLPLELFDRVDVYRSQAPMQSGAPLPGGVVSLNLDDRFTGLRLAAGAGSFAYRRASVSAGAEGKAGTTVLHAAYSGSGNAFPFFDDNGTPLNTGDDSTSDRQNNDYNTGSALLSHRARIGHWRLAAFGMGTLRNAGVAGISTVQNEATRLSAWRALVGTSARASRLADGNLDLSLVGSVGMEGSDFDDPQAETSLLPQDTHQTARTGLVSVRPAWWLHPQLAVRTLLEWQNESARFREATETIGLTSASRNTLATGLELETFLVDDRLHASASIRADHQRNAAAGNPAQLSSAPDPSRTLLAPQAGAGIRAIRAQAAVLDVFGSVSAADRAPSFFELYGVQGTLVGNPELRPESRIGADAGLRAASTDGDVVWQAQYAWFTRRVDDIIVFVENGQGIAIPRNVRAATISGHEAQFSVGWQNLVSLNTSYTALDAIQQSEDPTLDRRRLPYRARHQGTVELEGGIPLLRAAYRIDAYGEWFLDERELRPIPARALHGIDVTLTPPLKTDLSLIASVTNLADQRTQDITLPDGGQGVRVPRAIADYTGFPLPGRAFYLTLTVRPRLNPHPDQQ